MSAPLQHPQRMTTVLPQLRFKENPPCGWKLCPEIVLDAVDAADKLIRAAVRLQFCVDGDEQIIGPLEDDEAHDLPDLGSPGEPGMH